MYCTGHRKEREEEEARERERRRKKKKEETGLHVTCNKTCIMYVCMYV